jgi:preprotein translocase subunit YajC
MLGNTILAASATVTAATKAKSSSGSSYTFLLILIVLFGVFYFVMWRPNSQRRRKMMQQQREISPGNRVRTTAGMYATVVAIEDDDVILEVAPGVHSRFVRRAVMEVLPDGTAEPTFADSGDEDDSTGPEDEVHDFHDESSDSEVHDVLDHDGDESHNGSAPAAEESKTAGTV